MPIMVAKKRSGQKTANYFFSLNTVDPKPEGRSYIGKLRQLGDKGQYSLFGQGENPNKTVRIIAHTNIQGPLELSISYFCP